MNMAHPQPLAAKDLLGNLRSLVKGDGWANDDCPFPHYVDETKSELRFLSYDDIDEVFVLIDRLSGAIYSVTNDWEYVEQEIDTSRTMMYALPARIITASVGGAELPEDYQPLLKCLSEYERVVATWPQAVDYGDDNTVDAACDRLARDGGWSDDLLRYVIEGSHASLPSDCATCTDTANIKHVKANFPELWSVIPHLSNSTLINPIRPQDHFLVAWQAAQVLDVLEDDPVLDDNLCWDEQADHLARHGHEVVKDVVDDARLFACKHDVPMFQGELDILEDSDTIASDFLGWLNNEDEHQTHTFTVDSDDVINLVSTGDYEPLKDHEAYRLILTHGSKLSAKTVDAIAQTVINVRKERMPQW